MFGGGQIHALVLQDKTNLIGFVPLFCWGQEVRTVSFLGAGISDYGDILFLPGREAECIAATLQYLNQHGKEWDVLDLQEVPQSDVWQSACSLLACSVCPVLDLRTYPDSMDGKHRTDVRRSRNKLAKRSDLHMETASEATLHPSLDALFRLHAARWESKHEAGVLGESKLQQFHREAAAAFLKHGGLRLQTLSVEGSIAAVIYAFAVRDTLYCYLSGFDPALSRLSPGAALLGWTVEQAIAEGLTYVDFLRQPEAYKYLWGAKDQPTFRLRLSRAEIPFVAEKEQPLWS